MGIHIDHSIRRPDFRVIEMHTQDHKTKHKSFVELSNPCNEVPAVVFGSLGHESKGEHQECVDENDLCGRAVHQ